MEALISKYSGLDGGVERKENMPKANQIQKRKFLCAIGKEAPSPTEEDDEKFLTKFNSCKKFNTQSKTVSLHWSDSIAADKIKTILEENQNFDVGHYLNCTKIIYLTYSDRYVITNEVYTAFTYILTHARSFDDTSQNLFQLQRSFIHRSFQLRSTVISNALPDSVYMKKISKLIEELRAGYDDTKFRILNVNVTYLTLLVLRRFVRREKQFYEVFTRMNTHDDYVKLCPHPLNNQLPRIGQRFNIHISNKHLIDSVILALHAFLTGGETDNPKTKRILRATCVQHIEWTGLQVPHLFFRVVSLYGIEEGALWESLSHEETIDSLCHLADDYYKQYKKRNANPPETTKWFPFCRALNGDFHRVLSAAVNKDLCMALAYLIDLKLGFKKSSVRNSHWAKNDKSLEKWLNVAKSIHELYE